MDLKPIGVVRSTVAIPGTMPIEGVSATIEVFPQFADGLRSIEQNSHIFVIAWLDQADRLTLLVHGRRRASGPLRGVFGLRSSARPNPLGLTATRLLEVNDRFLHVDRLDFVNGTPVIDIKRYSPGWDCCFAATTTRETTYRDESDADLFQDLAVAAMNFHGEFCSGVALAVRMMAFMMRHWRIGPRHPDLRIAAPVSRCIVDALQGISGATLGSGRLEVIPGLDYHFTVGPEILTVRTLPMTPSTPEAIFAASDTELFQILPNVDQGGT